MTTQHTHHEHGDVDATVVENSSVPENEMTISSSASEADVSVEVASSPSEDFTTLANEPEHASSDVPPVVEASTNVETPVEVSDKAEAATASEITLEADTHSVTPLIAEAAPTELSAIQQGEPSGDAEKIPAVQEQIFETVTIAVPLDEERVPTEALEVAAEQVDKSIEVQEDIEPSHSVQPESHIAQPVQEELPEVTPSVTEIPVEQAPEQLQATTEEEPASPVITFPYAEGAALIDARAEEVRPFTDFIAEFRQAEALLQATLRDSQADAFSLLTSVAANLASSENQETPELIESTEKIFSDKNDHAAKSEQQEAPIANVHPEAGTEENNSAVKSEEEAKPTTRPVSPLLRPASRLRLPRHGLGRHEREEAPQPVAEEPEAVAKLEIQPEVEAVVEPVAPRPARRYRFDRPAAGANGSASTTSVPKSASRNVQPTTQLKAEEKQEKLATPAPAAQEAKHTSEPSVAASTASTVQTPEPQAQPVSKKHANTVQEIESATPAQTVEHGRRRHTQKEPPVVTPVQEAAPVIEPPTVSVEPPVVRKEDIAPEDLPPLEYSELQKASSRRRRRHRSGSSSTAPHMQQNVVSIPEAPIAMVPPTPIVPPAPVPTSAPMPVQSPRIPAAATSDQINQLYNIVSGYTVSQMNQGNEVTGPFMGPEPSPARGSITSRDGRNTRAEARPTPPPALYSSSRSPEGGISAAAMTQFANIVGQALQTQTDRIVTEFPPC